MALNVCVFPALSVTVSVTVLPGATSVLPEIVGVVSLPEPRGSRDRVGAAEFMSPLTVSVAVLPAASVAVAVTSKFPSAIGLGTSALKSPLPSTVAVNVCTVPTLSVTVIVTVLPVARSVLPLIVGVLSLPVPSGSRVIIGAVLSTLPPVSESEPWLPAAS